MSGGARRRPDVLPPRPRPDRRGGVRRRDRAGGAGRGRRRWPGAVDRSSATRRCRSRTCCRRTWRRSGSRSPCRRDFLTTWPWRGADAAERERLLGELANGRSGGASTRTSAAAASARRWRCWRPGTNRRSGRFSPPRGRQRSPPPCSNCTSTPSALLRTGRDGSRTKGAGICGCGGALLAGRLDGPAHGRPIGTRRGARSVSRRRGGASAGSPTAGAVCGGPLHRLLALPEVPPGLGVSLAGLEHRGRA